MKLQLLTLALILCCASEAVHTADKLKISLYVEALCPDSKNTIQNSFTPAIKNGLLDMADVTYYLAGNASDDTYVRGSGEYKFTCQHDSIECGANIMENCMLRLAKDNKTALQSIGCMFDNIERHSDDVATYDAFVKCNTQFYKDDIPTLTNIENCAGPQISQGFDFFDDAIQATPKEHTFIPWAAVDGITLSQTDRDLINSNVLKWACDRYQGAKPAACQTSSRFLSLIE